MAHIADYADILNRFGPDSQQEKDFLNSNKELSELCVISKSLYLGLKRKNISFNICDDFHDDGHVPAGEIQETFGYLKNNKLGDEDKIQIIRFIYDFLKEKLESKGVTLKCGDTRIVFQHITHQVLEQLITELDDCNLRYNGIQVEFRC